MSTTNTLQRHFQTPIKKIFLNLNHVLSFVLPQTLIIMNKYSDCKQSQLSTRSIIVNRVGR